MPDAPESPRRVVPDSEYRTSYVEPFQLRLPPPMYDQLCERARRDRITMKDLVLGILEAAVTHRAEARK